MALRPAFSWRVLTRVLSAISWVAALIGDLIVGLQPARNLAGRSGPAKEARAGSA